MTFSPELIRVLLLLIPVITQGIFFLIALSNYLAAPVIRPVDGTDTGRPPVSIMVPARNEEKNIGPCIEALLTQNYPLYEILIYDDSSSDQTRAIAAGFEKQHEKLTLIEGTPLPEGWLGKNRACHELSRRAKGELLLFIDADVCLSPDALTSAVSMMKKYQTGLLSCFPRQRLTSPGEYLVVPVMNWFLLSLLSLPVVYLKPWKPFVAANGQFMLFDRQTYDSVGGHAAVAAKVVEDMELARRVKAENIPMMTALGGDRVSCTMYEGFNDAVEGFTKNFYPGFDAPVTPFLLLIFFLAVLFTAPLFLPLYKTFLWPLAIPVLMQRFVLARTTKDSVFLSLLLHPFQMLVMVYVALRSVVAAKRKNITWKGRKI